MFGRAARDGEPEAEATAPCLDVCQLVEERCPHLVPDPDDGSGEPAFLCGASHPFGAHTLSQSNQIKLGFLISDQRSFNLMIDQMVSKAEHSSRFEH